MTKIKHLVSERSFNSFYKPMRTMGKKSERIEEVRTPHGVMLFRQTIDAKFMMVLDAAATVLRYKFYDLNGNTNDPLYNRLNPYSLEYLRRTGNFPERIVKVHYKVRDNFSRENRELTENLEYNSPNPYWIEPPLLQIMLSDFRRLFPFLKRLRIDDFKSIITKLNTMDITCEGYRVRVSNTEKRSKSEKDFRYCEYRNCGFTIEDYNQTSKLAYAGLHPKTIKKDSSGRIQDAGLVIWFKTTLGFLYMHNVYTLNTNKVPWIFYDLPYNAQDFYRIFCMSRGWGDTFPLDLSIVAKRMRWKDKNIRQLKYRTLKPILKSLSPLLTWSKVAGKGNTILIQKKNWKDVKMLHTEKVNTCENKSTGKDNTPH